MRPRPTLLGIPPELRLHIFEYVVLLDVEFEEKPSHAFTDDITRAQAYVQDISIPWLNLLRTNKSIANELRAWMSSNDFRRREQNRTWEVDTSMTSRYGHKVTGLRLPCNSRDVDAAVITHTLLPTQSASEDDIAPAIVNSIYNDVWNPLRRSAPRMLSTKKLRPMPNLRKCTFNVVDVSDVEARRGQRPDMTMFRAAIDYYGIHGRRTEETVLNILSLEGGERVSQGKLSFYGRKLVEVSGFQLTPMVCDEKDLKKWKRYRARDTLV